MHAKHADNSELNDLSPHMIGCATITRQGARQTSWSVRILIGKPRLAIKHIAHEQ
jgi:hypothetical protein